MSINNLAEERVGGSRVASWPWFVGWSFAVAIVKVVIQAQVFGPMMFTAAIGLILGYAVGMMIFALLFGSIMYGVQHLRKKAKPFLNYAWQGWFIILVISLFAMYSQTTIYNWNVHHPQNMIR